MMEPKIKEEPYEGDPTEPFEPFDDDPIEPFEPFDGDPIELVKVEMFEGLRKYTCQFCKKCFTIKENLGRHIKTVHEGLRQFQCGSCGRRFSDARSCIDHEDVTHRGIKKYKCHLCEKSFGQKPGLRQHIETFHEGKRHMCETCGKEFKQRAHLKSHIKIHHDVQKDHKCDICGNEFFERNKLKRHIRNVHKVQMDYKCEICEKIFCQMSDVHAHYIKVHEVIEGYNAQNKEKIPKRKRKKRQKLTYKLNEIYKLNLKSFSISVEKFSPDFCEKCDKYFCSEIALQNHIDFTHLIENVLNNDDANVNENDSEVFIENNEIAQKVICDICNKEFDSAKDMMAHTALEHLAETIHFATNDILKMDSTFDF